MMLRLARSATSTSCRGFSTRRKTQTNVLPSSVLDALPNFDETPSASDQTPANRRAPVTSAHCIDVDKQQVSTLDSVAINPSGTPVHGVYGELKNAEAIPLEYLALLRPAAEGAAAVRVTAKKPGTFLIYGATQANGIAAAQIASAAGHAVVAVAGVEHSGNRRMMGCLKGLIAEPGTAVPAEYAVSKKNFADLVKSISTGHDGIVDHPAEDYLKDFKENLLAYSEAYPDTRPAAVSEEELEFKYMEKDREHWEQNMEAYLSQFPPGAPPVDKAKFDAYFSTEQYQVFKDKFWAQTSAVISGDDIPFSAPHIVKDQIETPGKLDHVTYHGAGPFFPYSFNILKPRNPEGTEPRPGGPIVGAAIAVTPDLQIAAEKVGAAKTLRAKGEALQFLTQMQRNCFAAAASVAAQARKAGAPIVVMGGSLPGLETVKSTDVDVATALKAMDIDENGESQLNFFVQVYRANEFPFYAAYAVHRASEVLAGPRQIIVTK